MRLHEFEAKGLFKKRGISTPQGEVARSMKDSEEAARKIGKPVALKAQVLVGGRGKVGGIRFAETPQEAGRVAGEILGKRIKGELVEEVLVEERLNIGQELYAGITVDGAAGVPVVIASLEGGIDVEAVAAERPERIRSRHLDPFGGLKAYEARRLAKDLGLQGEAFLKFADVLLKLYRLFEDYDALIAEINPLVITREGAIMAADAVLEIDDSGLYRHPEYKGLALERTSDALAREGKEIGVSYVGLDGDIGVICSGAGLGMASIDLIGKWGRPANFLETGGGITEKLMADAMRLVMKKPGLRGIFINLYGGINPIHEGAKGIARVIREDSVSIPVVAKALGNFQEETWKTLEEAGVTVVKTRETEPAVEELFRRMKR